jgi:hypothetical protein
MYDGCHYNPIQYGNATPQDKNFTTPIWVTSPPTQREKKKRTVISFNDNDSDSDSNNEDHISDEETNVARHRQEKIKME